MWFFRFVLKRQVPRLRDWNETEVSLADIIADLKRQVPRLRDWNSIRMPMYNFIWGYLKRQVPRLRDWNKSFIVYLLQCFSLETTSTSITRLKLRVYNHSAARIHTWNDKYLDYEIETILCCRSLSVKRTLETTSTSITRLKLHVLHHVGCNVFTWNDKYLDYEIETSNHQRDVFLYTPWNDKYLDYEIETASQEPLLCQPLTLKRQVPRLRDWNSHGVQSCVDFRIMLETTSTSITRLKL